MVVIIYMQNRKGFDSITSQCFFIKPNLVKTCSTNIAKAFTDTTLGNKYTTYLLIASSFGE